MELSDHRQFHCWRDATERHAGALMIVRPEPTGGLVLHLFDRVEEGSGQTGASDCAVVALDIGILLRLARLDVFDPDARAFGPGQ